MGNIPAAVAAQRSKQLRAADDARELSCIKAEIAAEFASRQPLAAAFDHLTDGEPEEMVELIIKFDGFPDPPPLRVRRETNGINLKRIAIDHLAKEAARTGASSDDLPFEWDATLIYAGDVF